MRVPALSRFLLLSAALTMALAIGVSIAGRLGGTPPVAQAAVPGFGNLSGTVQSGPAFKAAQVLIRNVDKRILYMVYTNGGRFRSVALFPGNYEVSARSGPLQSDVQKLVVKAGDNAPVTLSLRDAATASQRTIVTALESETIADANVQQEASYDEVYPPGPAREIAERTCLICHGENFIPTRPATRGTWTARIDGPGELAPGTPVRVSRIDGATEFVRPLPEEQNP